MKQKTQPAWLRDCQAGLQALRAGDAERAVKFYNQALCTDSNSHEALALLGSVHFDQDRCRQALACLCLAARHQTQAGYLFNYAMALRALDRHEQATSVLREAIRLDPGDPLAFHKLGLSLMSLLRYEEALPYLHTALDLDPDNVRAAFDIASCHLAIGNFQLGWEAYECRYGLPNLMLKGRSLIPPWRGEKITGRLLLGYEQGIGDMIQFIRLAGRARELCEQLVVEAPPEIQELLLTVEGVDEVIAPNQQVSEDFDAFVPYASLPGIFAFDPVVSGPGPMPYMHPSKERVAMAAGWLAPLRSQVPRVGLVWAGNPKNEIDKERSLPFHYFLRFLETPGVNFVSLQHGQRALDLENSSLTGLVFNAKPYLRSFADTAAIIAHLDLVICCDTSVAHVAAAMAKPVWILQRRSTDWRWMLNYDDNPPWYPSARLFRQTKPRNWDDVIDSTARELRNFAAKGVASRS